MHFFYLAGVALQQMPEATMNKWHAQMMYKSGNTGLQIMDGQMEGKIFVSIVQIA